MIFTNIHIFLCIMHFSFLKRVIQKPETTIILFDTYFPNSPSISGFLPPVIAWATGISNNFLTVYNEHTVGYFNTLIYKVGIVYLHMHSFVHQTTGWPNLNLVVKLSFSLKYLTSSSQHLKWKSAFINFAWLNNNPMIFAQHMISSYVWPLWRRSTIEMCGKGRNLSQCI